jgi:hypothetical protein
MLYRVHLSNTALDNMCQSAEAVLHKVFADPSLSAHVRKDEQKIMAAFHLGYSQAYLRLNQRKAAFRHWRLAYRSCHCEVLATLRGAWATLKLFLPYPLIFYLPRLKKLLALKAQRWASSKSGESRAT